MELLIPVLINCALAAGIYLLDKYTSFKNLKYSVKQIIIGLCFGGLSAFASSYGVKWLGTVVNVRDAAPLTAGLIFGAPAGIISGVIGGAFRLISVLWNSSGAYTMVACSLATVLAGVMAAVLRKLMFDNKKPTWGYGVCIAIACEVVHMILIFITNMDNPSYAFEFVQGATVPMMIGNSAAVGIALIIVSLLSHEPFIRKHGKGRIAYTFQRWLLLCIFVAYLVTSSFTFILQNGMVKIETQEVFTTAINDVEKDIRGKSEAQLRGIAGSVKEDYTLGRYSALDALAKEYGLEEINVVDKNGVIIFSSVDEYVGYNMADHPQSKEFVDELSKKEFFVQEFGPMGNDSSLWRKYAAVRLSDGGFIQVGYNEKQFYDMFDEFIVDVTKNRHVGTGGFVAVCNNSLKLVIDNEYSDMHISSIGIVPNEQMLKGDTATALNYAEIINEKTSFRESYMYVFKFVEGYCIIAAMPEAEATFMRDASFYTSIFMQVLIFASMFVFIYVLIKRVIINNLNKVNSTLGRITKGDLDVTVDVRTSEEFSSLSDDINSTVTTLKRYIAEAAARIDKELEYAKQIQLSALPKNFPSGGDYEIYAQMIAAKEVGGDFYDFYQLDSTRVAFLAADVSGKGIPAAMFMMTAKTIIKDLAESGVSVGEIFTRANEKLCENNESGMFVTAWMGILDTSTGVVRFANAGHNPPILRKADGSFEYLRSRPGFVLAGMEGIKYRENELTLGAGDRLLLYTDGVTEATDEKCELYGEERLLAFMNKCPTLKARMLLPALKADIDGFVGQAPQFDDITMLMLDYKPEKTKEINLDRTFPARVDALGDVLGFAEEALLDFGCSMKNMTALTIAIEEIFVNVARYAYGEGEGEAKLSISFDEEKRTAVFCMRDGGVPFDPLKKPDPDVTLSAEEREIGGLGIFITKKTMDAVYYEYENGENTLTMIKKI